MTGTAVGEPALAGELRRAWAAERCSYHMPGHKGGRGASPLARELLGAAAFEADVSEVGGAFDYLHAPEGALSDAQRHAAALFGAERTWFLVNGSTVGNIAAICTAVGEGDELLVARNSHRSVTAGLVLSGATPVYLAPVLHRTLDGFFGVDPADVARALAEHRRIRAVHITSPDYYGFTSAVADIAALCHARGVPLIVDEAHGTHFAFHPELPESALACGADVVVQSAHKTLGSLTQSSLIHVRGDLVDEDGLAAQLQLLQSSSPSALLLVSLDLACAAMAADGRRAMDETVRLAQAARSRIGAIAGLVLHGDEVARDGVVAGVDPTKLVVDVAPLGVSAFDAADWLRQNRRIAPEFADLRRMVFSITAGDDEDTVDVLVESLAALAATVAGDGVAAPIASVWDGDVPAVVLTPRQASRRRTVAVPLAEAAGRVAGEGAIPYPPGIPLIAPGERITTAVIASLRRLTAAGCRIVGLADPTAGTVRCIEADTDPAGTDTPDITARAAGRPTHRWEPPAHWTPGTIPAGPAVPADSAVPARGRR